MSSPIPSGQPAPALHQVALRAQDLPRATAFWSDLLGIEPLASFDPPGLVFFDLSGTRLLLDVGAPSGLIYLRVDSVRQRVADLRARGIEVVNGPHVIFHDDQGTFGEPGRDEWMAFIRDSEGNLVGLASQELPA